ASLCRYSLAPDEMNTRVLSGRALMPRQHKGKLRAAASLAGDVHFLALLGDNRLQAKLLERFLRGLRDAFQRCSDNTVALRGPSGDARLERIQRQEIA